MGHTKEYWEKNKKTLLAKRAKRYKTDPEYRDKIKARSKANRAAARERIRKEPFLMMHNGKQYAGIPVKEVCEKLGINSDRLKYYQKREYIPMAFVSVPKRHYTKHQISEIKKLVSFLKDNTHTIKKVGTEGDKARLKLAKIKEEIHKTWEN